MCTKVELRISLRPEMGNKTYILISKATFANKFVDENMQVRDKLKSKTNTTYKTSVKLFESHHG